MSITPPLVRFAKLVERDDFTGCWMWAGATYVNGYGAFWFDQKVTPVHRAAYMIMVDEVIPEGYEIDHLCRVRLCVNPDHLEAVPRNENAARKRAVMGVLDFCRAAGHPLTDDNVYRGNGKTRWQCRECTLSRTNTSRFSADKPRRTPGFCPQGHPKVGDWADKYYHCRECVRQRRAAA